MVIITGANTGIGKATAMDLAGRGAKVYMACRDHKRCEEARKEIIEKTGNVNVYNRVLDLSSLESVRKFANKFVLNLFYYFITTNDLICNTQLFTSADF